MRALAVLLSLWLAIAPAVAGQMSLLGAGKAGGSAPPTVSYVGSFAGSSTTNTVTATVDIGNPSYIATRRVIIAVLGGSSATTPVSGTINGQAFDQLTALSSSCTNINCVEFVSAPVSSGTTSVAFSLTYSATLFTSPRVLTFTVDDSLLSSKFPVASFVQNSGTSGLVTTTVNTTTKVGGFIVAGNWCGGGAGPSITASTETYTTDYSSSAYLGAHVNGISSNASSSVSTQCPPAGGAAGLGLAAWR
jgi:hypothetical protein